MLFLKARAMMSLPPVEFFGLRKDLLANVGHAKDILKTIEEQTTPMEMLYVLQDTIDSFSQRHDDITTATSVAGDEILPALVCAIEAHPLPHLKTLEYYMENFVFVDLSTSQLGYSLATFKAAILFINSTFNKLSPDMKRKLLPALGIAHQQPKTNVPPYYSRSFRGSFHRPSPSMSPGGFNSPSHPAPSMSPPSQMRPRQPSGGASFPYSGGIPVSQPNQSMLASGSSQSSNSLASSISSVPSHGSSLSRVVEDPLSVSVPESRAMQRPSQSSYNLRPQPESPQEPVSHYSHQRMQSAMPNLQHQQLRPSAAEPKRPDPTPAARASSPSPDANKQQQQQQQQSDGPRLGSFLAMLASKSGTVSSSQTDGNWP